MATPNTETKRGRVGTFKPSWRMGVSAKGVSWVRLDPYTGKPDETTRENR